uniref:EF-hand domain-containing protein n=1 Tax=Globisporangium ultimum (strain ATCC 200006 / CBS 805.95 / DAOM BR144) TaxID=431595 RepID=K3W6B6_GLOUD
QAVFSEIARILPLELKEEVLVLFSEISRHGETQVGVNEFAAYLAQGGYRLTYGEVKSFLSRLDLNGDGFLAMDEFCAAFLDWSSIQAQAPEQWNALVTTIFDELDENKDGQLSLDDLARLAPFAEYRKAPTHSFRSDTQRCFRQADINANGWIDRDEFERMLHIQVQAYAHFAQRLS